MLVLSRKAGESIRIGDDIEVRVIEVRGGRIRLGISAPLATPVHRQEIVNRLAPIADLEVDATEGDETHAVAVARNYGQDSLPRGHVPGLRLPR